MDEFNGIKVGDIVTGYFKGYWEVTKIEDRSSCLYKYPVADGSLHPKPLIYGRLVMSDNNKLSKPGKGAEKSWDISYSHVVDRAKIDKDYQAVLDAAMTKRIQLLNLIAGANK